MFICWTFRFICKENHIKVPGFRENQEKSVFQAGASGLFLELSLSQGF